MSEGQKTLEQRILDAKRANRVARIPYITAGFPKLDDFIPILKDLDEYGSDIIEIGIPFSDPVADGPVVEDASRRALINGVSLHWIFEKLKTLDKPLKAGLVLMGYYNPFLQYGFDALVRDCLAVGVQGLVVPDLPLEESRPLKEALKKADINLVTLVGPNTSEERMREYADDSQGYVYVVSVLGTTGMRSQVSHEANATLERARKVFDIPVALGFGIKNPEQVQAMSVQPDAAVFGSALLRHLDEGGTVKDFMEPWLK